MVNDEFGADIFTNNDKMTHITIYHVKIKIYGTTTAHYESIF